MNDNQYTPQDGEQPVFPAEPVNYTEPQQIAAPPPVQYAPVPPPPPPVQYAPPPPPPVQYAPVPMQGQPQIQYVQVQPPMIPRQPSNGLGTAGLVLAIIGAVLGWIPFLGWIIWLLGLIFSFVGVFRVPRGLAVAGLCVSLGSIVLILFVIGSIFGAGWYSSFDFL